ncbi:RNA 2',3'-cyclic phosphodiesterase [Limibaculum sp. M0105]|uniref:RNA 2',3'-cyclic phosphodiesterase n=1 Tax=Thermohalobaculum xanthum TaxID=2753746 RepID=A0A8J7MBI8_9RHOB|nr:RNA 2',3'-cyclic phosphodiesterase [Thermohalobaculum xanthum]MBK0401139.1 RNA 2',3'-cyclic phosphodiesterase [Thermohalobaculum xanthum]
MIRAFVGIAIPPQVATRLAAAQLGLPAGRAVPPENFHITLAFLGEQPEPVIEDMHHALGSLRAPRFSLRIDGMDLFGGAQPTILHARIAPDPALVHLRAKVLQAARHTGIQVRGGRYTPHVTLARLGNGLRAEDIAALHGFAAARAGLSSEPFEVEDFILFRSRLGKQGPSYEALADYPLD